MGISFDAPLALLLSLPLTLPIAATCGYRAEAADSTYAAACSTRAAAASRSGLLASASATRASSRGSAKSASQASSTVSAEEAPERQLSGACTPGSAWACTSARSGGDLSVQPAGTIAASERSRTARAFIGPVFIGPCSSA